ncbi:MAG: hypothetical protein IKQ92_01160 [Clostridia bacterium]|nr:hypothetical protein [Clostridia bacterium]
MEKKKKSKVGGTVGAVAVVAVVLGVLFGTGKLGFGSGLGLGGSAPEAEKTAAETPAETPADTQERSGESETDKVFEIRVQGREYNYENVTYGGAEHPLDDLIAALADADKDARIQLIVEDSATKNAVDDLKAALTAAGFTNVHSED